jgi:hypothetical protein
MKKENQSKKKTKTMTTKSVSKSIQSMAAAITEFVVKISDDDIQQNMIDNHDELIAILSTNMPTQQNTKVKLVKDPNAPKRGKSSYILFCISKRDSVKESNPEMSAKDIIKELGRVWREDVSDKDKAKYTKMAVSDKNRYENEMKDYTPPAGTLRSYKKEKKVGPKRALSAYIFYCNVNRSVLMEENSELSTKVITSNLGKGWRELSDKDRKPYHKMALKDKDRFEDDKANWGSVDEPTKSLKKKKKTVQ